MGFIGKVFAKQGALSARYPCTSIFIGLILVAFGSLGFVNYQSTVSLH